MLVSFLLKPGCKGSDVCLVHLNLNRLLQTKLDEEASSDQSTASNFSGVFPPHGDAFLGMFIRNSQRRCLVGHRNAAPRERSTHDETM